MHLQLSYSFSVLLLALFGISFFSFEYYVPYIKRWKANQFLYQSQVYLDEKIGSSPELIREGIRKARVAYLLNPNDPQSYQNYLNLLFWKTQLKLSIFGLNWSINQRMEFSWETRSFPNHSPAYKKKTYHWKPKFLLEKMPFNNSNTLVI